MKTEWRELYMLSFRADRSILLPYLPVGTELDLYEGSPIVSIVAFRFQHMAILGCPMPFFQDFSQINLRFYVYRDTEYGRIPGVVFIKELCPFALVSFGARLLYGENYVTTPTSFQSQPGGKLIHKWIWKGKENFLSAEVSGALEAPAPGTPEEFIIERFHGYCGLAYGRTAEFQISHRPWKLRAMKKSAWQVDGGDIYGAQFKEVLSRAPVSCALVDGSEVLVGWRRRLSVERQKKAEGEVPPPPRSLMLSRPRR